MISQPSQVIMSQQNQNFVPPLLRDANGNIIPQPIMNNKMLQHLQKKLLSQFITAIDIGKISPTITYNETKDPNIFINSFSNIYREWVQTNTFATTKIKHKVT